jgi:hypothetical protein
MGNPEATWVQSHRGPRPRTPRQGGRRLGSLSVLVVLVPPPVLLGGPFATIERRAANHEVLAPQPEVLLIAVSRVAPRAATGFVIDEDGMAWLVVQDGQEPAPGGELVGDGDISDGVRLRRSTNLTHRRRRRGCLRRRGGVQRPGPGPSGAAWPYRPGIGCGGLSQTASTKSRRMWLLPVLLMDPWREPPEEYSVGMRPTKEPSLLPVNRCQSPISTASVNLVRVLAPRRQASRRTTGVNSPRAANCSVATPSQPRRALLR